MKSLAVVAGVAAALSVGAGVASAEYRQPGPTLTLDPAAGAARAPVIATVRSDCVDGSTVDFQIEPAGDLTVGICSNDSFVGRLIAPPNPGSFDVIADGVGLVIQARLTVTAALEGSEEPLPSTGSDDVLPVALIGGRSSSGVGRCSAWGGSGTDVPTDRPQSAG